MLLFSSLAKSIFHTNTFSCIAIRNSRIFSFTTATNGFPSTSSISTNPFTIIKSHKHILFYYLNNRTLDQARAFFDQIPSPHVSLYTIMLHAYASNHRLHEAIHLFRQIPFKDVVSWNSMIKGCLHCGDIVTARKLFDEMPHRTVVSWTTLVDGLLRFGVVEEAEALFWAMDPMDRDVAAWNAMIHGYCGNGRVDDALRLFRQMPSKDVISWSSIIAGLDHNGESEQALVVFRDMVASGVCPSSVGLVCGLSAAAKILAFHVGIQIHCSALKLGDWRFDEFVSASLVTFYSCCKQIESACWVFCEALCKNVVVWTALLTGYGFND
ncbi:pentatricopeptide repeat-containing protein At5g46460, mitochondrial-like, partial [Vigna umbellata]|uniref:pentatricopeptide repeat-containing protein At5g46460, mitochondrial-like n=1 Tax=Vigna umbellata TaxID=87088 RepID=UPI001F5EB02A